VGAGGQREAVQALLFAVAGAVVIGPMEVAAQQVVACIALVLYQPDHAAHGHAHQGQRVAGQHEGTLDRFGHDLRGTGGAQALQGMVILGSPTAHREAETAKAHRG